MIRSEPKVRQIYKLLIANRGEIAARVTRSAKRMGIDTIGIVSNSDPVSTASQTIKIDGTNPVPVFLDPRALIKIALEHGADAIHPGYGYLSENGEFARMVEEAGLIFVGPSAGSIFTMGNKPKAREIAVTLDIPVPKAITGSITRLLEQCNHLPYPLLVKASAGGGGKGMITVLHRGELEENLIKASREAHNYFGDGSVFLEQLIEDSRHVEVQVLGDKHGNMVHLYERECSIQRRYQKIIEEAPSPSLDGISRQKLTSDALKICKAINYYSAGTVEFLVDSNGNHYFLEMNTRIQVEHPVTEAITGIDIVEQQLRVAMGLPLMLNQEDISITGHAIECRVYAEDTENNFAPSPGYINNVIWPPEELARTDTWFNQPLEISAEHDPLVAKIITTAATRFEAINKAIAALDKTSLQGLVTNIKFLRDILLEDDFRSGKTTTGYCSSHPALPVQAPRLEILAAAYIAWLQNYKPNGKSVWHQTGYFRVNNQASANIAEQELEIKWENRDENGAVKLMVNRDLESTFYNVVFTSYNIKFDVNQETYSFSWSVLPCGNLIFEYHHKPILVKPAYIINNESMIQHRDNFIISGSPLHLRAPLPGKITAILVAKGAPVKKGDRLVTLETMKMENHLSSAWEGIIGEIFPRTGQQVKAGETLLTFKHAPVEN